MAPRRRSYALLALLLAAGAPLGLGAVRALRAGTASWAWIREDISGDAATYLYVAVSTAAAFALFGYGLGRRADHLWDLSRTDTLTGLRNARVFRERLDEEVARERRYGHPLSLLLIDVDWLKKINDRSGHRGGDDALVHVARALQQTARSTDVAARWGGDEFALLAPDTGAEDAVRLAERIRSLVSATALANGELVTVSIGVATTTGSRDGPGLALRERADAALYSAKQQGRNRVVGNGRYRASA
jgi:diguanylate cyclase (GGDEF)-like protein